MKSTIQNLVRKKQASRTKRDDLAFKIFLMTDEKTQKQLAQCKKDQENGDYLDPRCVLKHK